MECKTGSGTYSQYTESPDLTDEASIKKYGGFYIGRYEAGKGENGKVLIQNDKYPYNNITQSDCVTKSTNFASNNGYATDAVRTKIASSYAWDTALCFIENTVLGYATDSSSQGNYNGGGGIKNTGSTIAVCNIYDMGGNVAEYTSESSSRSGYPRVCRGGCYIDSNPAGYRGTCGGVANAVYGFRLTLYLM